ncbi:hypothetical protein Tco_1377685 [Tanacetum coccineum]
MPYLQFTTLIVTYVMSKNDKIHKRPLSFQHIIKLDTPLGNLKFTNKGLKDPVFGMPIPEVMLNEDIKASADYLEYLANSAIPAHSEEVAKSKETIPARVTGRCKGFLTKNGVEIAVEKVSIPKRKRTQIVIEEIGQSKEVVANEADSEATDEEESDIKKAQNSSKNDFFIQQRTKGQGERSGAITEVSDEIEFKSSNEEAEILPEVPDRLRDESSSSSFKSQLTVEDISSDDEEKTNEATEKAEDVAEKDDIVTENVKMIEVEKNTDEQVAEEQLPEIQTRDKGLEATTKLVTEA